MKANSKKLMRDVLAAMRTAGIPPHLMHAYERTGFLVLEEKGYKNMSPEDRAEYDNAIDEYFATRKER